MVVEVPARQLYDHARAQILRGLIAGGVRILWDQFPTGKLFALQFPAFRAIFGPGWKRYRPWRPPVDEAVVLRRPEAQPKRTKSLSYQHALENQVQFHNLLNGIQYFTFIQLPYQEVRYLTGAHNLQSWCDFGSLLPANPALSGTHTPLSHTHLSHTHPSLTHRVIKMLDKFRWRGQVRLRYLDLLLLRSEASRDSQATSIVCVDVYRSLEWDNISSWGGGYEFNRAAGSRVFY